MVQHCRVKGPGSLWIHLNISHSKLSRPWSSKEGRHVTAPPPYFTVGMTCWYFPSHLMDIFSNNLAWVVSIHRIFCQSCCFFHFLKISGFICSCIIFYVCRTCQQRYRHIPEMDSKVFLTSLSILCGVLKVIFAGRPLLSSQSWTFSIYRQYAWLLPDEHQGFYRHFCNLLQLHPS